jgi:hypothetical protein
MAEKVKDTTAMGVDLSDPRVMAFVLEKIKGASSGPSRLEELLTLEFEEKRAKKVAQVEQTQKAKSSIIAEMAAQRARVEREQLGCDHLKPNKQEANVNGQRDMHGVIHLVCSRCQATFTLDNLPGDVRARLVMYRIGGPDQMHIQPHAYAR